MMQAGAVQLALYSEAIRLLPAERAAPAEESSKLHSNRAAALMKLGRHAEAIANAPTHDALRAAIELAQTPAEAHLPQHNHPPPHAPTPPPPPGASTLWWRGSARWARASYHVAFRWRRCWHW